MPRMTSRRAVTWVAGCVAAFALALVQGCVTRTDALAPIVAITEPKSGTTRSTEDLRIVGYAMDDEGIAAIRVDGTDLLSFDVYASERGRSFVEFAFTLPGLQDGETSTRIVVEDVTGRRSALTYVLRIDTTPPTIELLEAVRLEDGRLRVDGVARDDVAVSAITVGGVPLPISPTQEHRFSLATTASPGSVVVVEDAAGNRTEVVLP